ncbi:glycosyltransferase family 2 protein [Chloroflexota bacterium]
MATYNHEAFIAEAIEIVLMQKIGFPYELVIGEDCSTDGTRAIFRDYGESYPEHVVCHHRR